MDTDVQILRNIEPLLKNSMVCGIQNHRFGTQMLNHVTEQGIDTITGSRATWFCMQAGFFYAEPNHPFIRHCLDVMYENGNRPFLKANGETNQFVIDWRLMAELTGYGAIYRDENQYLKDIDLMLYNSSVFATRKSKNRESYLVHWFDQSWSPAKTFKQRIIKFIKEKLFFLFRKI